MIGCQTGVTPGARIAVIVTMLLGAFPRTGAAGESGAQSKAPGKRNACLLVDRVDMERLAKGKVTLLNDILGDSQTNCEVYREGDSKNPVLVLAVDSMPGLGAEERQKNFVPLARKALEKLP